METGLQVDDRLKCWFMPGGKGTGKYIFCPSLIFLFSHALELLTDPVGNMFRKVVNKREELVGRHNDYNSQYNEHGKNASQAKNFSLGCAADKDFKTGSRYAPRHIHQNYCREKSCNHKGRPQKYAKHEKIGALAILSSRALSIRRSMSAEPERSRHQRLNHQNDLADQGRNPANERNSRQIIG